MHPNHLERRHEQSALHQDQPGDQKPTWSSGKVAGVDGTRGYTVRDDTTHAEYSRDRTHTKFPCWFVCSGHPDLAFATHLTFTGLLKQPHNMICQRNVFFRVVSDLAKFEAALP